MQRKKMAKDRSAKTRRAKASRDPASAELGASTDPDHTAGQSVPVVGIGASAGGIEALGRFFDAMPADSGCAFVVVLHLDPQRESEMAHILSARTTMPVVQVENGMRIISDHVYVIAPDTDLKVSNGGLHVSKPSEARGHRHPVDVLFRSLAADQRERAIAIVLSGTGSNGTEGLKEIRAEGGMKFGADARDREIRRHAEKRNSG